MRPRLRVTLAVAAAALAAAGATVGVTLAQSDKAASPVAGAAATSKPLQGDPPLVLELGVREDREAVALRRGSQLLDKGDRAAAARVFLDWHSLDAQVAQIIAQWSPDAGLRGLQALALEHPDSGLVQLHLGLALVWVGRIGDAEKAWRAAWQKAPDSPYAIHAVDLLHPDTPRGIPAFVPSFPEPAGLDKLSPAKQLAFLKDEAEQKGTWQARIAYGVELERLSMRVSAERQMALAAAAAPDNPEALTAAAFARFDKEAPARAFSQLGPLSQRFPKAATIRYHLGILLLWMGDVKASRVQLGKAVSLGPASATVVGAARAVLAELAKIK